MEALDLITSVNSEVLKIGTWTSLEVSVLLTPTANGTPSDGHHLCN